MSDITIKEVSAKKDFREFLRFPYSLFKDDKMWVPPLIADEKTTFNKKKNPALEFCDYKIFMAVRVAACHIPRPLEISGKSHKSA